MLQTLVIELKIPMKVMWKTIHLTKMMDRQMSGRNAVITSGKEDSCNYLKKNLIVAFKNYFG